MGLTLAFVAAAATIGSVHTLAPDHWMPFVALARAERWQARRTAIVTAACGLGHVTVSVLLGLAGVVLGLEIVQALGRRLEAAGGFLLIAFGIAYGAWGLHRSIQARWHTHSHQHLHWHPHGHGHHHHLGDETKMTPWMLFLLFSADPCVAVMPLMFAAAPFGWTTTAAVVVAYETATIATMVALVLPARAAAGALTAPSLDRYGDAIAGAVIAMVGIVVVSLGL